MQLKKYSHHILALGHLCSDINQGVLSAILPFLIAAYHYDYATAATLVMASNIVNSAIQPFFGFWADKKSRPWLMTLGVLLAGGGMALTGLISNFYGLCAAVMISGLGGAMFHPQAAQLVNRNADEHSKATKLGVFSFGGNLGFTLGPILAGATVSLFGLPGTLFFLLPPLVFAPLATLAFGHEDAVEKAAADAHSPVGEDRWGAFAALTLLVMGRSTIYAGVNTFLVLYLISEFGLAKTTGSACLSVYFAVCAASSLLGGKLADLYGSQRIIRLAFGLYMPAIALFSLTHNLLCLLALLLLMGFGVGLGYSPMVLIGQKYLPRHIGFASGITLGLSVSIGGIMSPLLGKLGDHFGLNSVFLVLTAVAAIPFIVSLLLPKIDPKLPPIPAATDRQSALNTPASRRP